MDVRCEKCQTEYELDEARLKPTGVTVKCTNCGHMFKIRRRANTNVGAPAPTEQRTRPASSKPPFGRADSMLNDDITKQIDTNDPTTVDKERNWLIRLETGEQKSCRELAVLQQWIVAGIVTRESLISRTGKTWKRLGDIGELQQYFTIADEARAQRSVKTTNEAPNKPMSSTMLGLGSAAKASAAAGGTILPDDDDGRPTGNFKPPPPPKTTKTPPMGAPLKPPPQPARTTPPPPPASERLVADKAPTIKPASINQTLAAVPPPPQMLAAAPTLPPTAPAPPVVAPPPPAPPPKPVTATPSQPTPIVEQVPAPPQLPRRPPTQPPPPPKAAAPKVPEGNRATATWATDDIKQMDDGEARGPSGPVGGRLGAIPNEPAFAGFAGRPRVEPSDSAVFAGKVKTTIDDGDDDVLPARRGSKAGLVIAIMSILVIGAAAAAVWLFVLNAKKETPGTKVATADAAVGSAVAQGSADAGAPVVTSLADASTAPADPLAAAKAELTGDVESKLKAQLDALADNKDAAAMRVRLATQLAQAELDRAGLVTDRAEADQLRKDSKALLAKTIADAQHAIKASENDALANVAYADLLRMQGRSAFELKKYLDKARKDLPNEVALVDALVLARDGKLDDAKSALAALVASTDDNRVRFHLALIAVAQNKPADAKPLVDQILAAQPEHPGARALEAKLSTLVAVSDPLPPEEHKDAGVGSAATTHKDGGSTGTSPEPVVGGSYDQLMEQAKKYADTNCTKAMEYYAKALEVKPTSVEALTGEGYCHLDAKQFSQAYSKFSTALTVSPRYEPALSGIAEMYQMQGNKDKAIEAWKRYLEAYPGAAKAQKHLDQLGAGSPPPPPNNGSDATPTPPPPPPPTPSPDQGSAGSAN